MARFTYPQKRHLTWLPLIVALLILTGQHYGWFRSTPPNTTPPTATGSYSINHFVDGDTIAVNMNGATETVRLIGVDTPETHKPHTPVQCYGPAASAFTKNTIGGQKVRLEPDPKSSDRDRYQRLLRYVYLPDGTLLNLKLIQEGYGFYYPYFPFTKSSEFNQAEQAAMAAHKGLWSNCNPTPTAGGGYVSNPAA